jgi:aminopeptidase YwaD
MQPLKTHQAGHDTAEAALGLTRSLLNQHPERITGTPGCLFAAEGVADCLRADCDRVTEEPFELHPGSFWNVGKIAAVTYGVSAVLLVVGGYFAWAAMAVSLLGLVYEVAHYILCSRLFDRLFPSAQGCNVVGIIEPAAEVRQQVLIVGHHDAPYVLSFLLGDQKWAGVRLLLAMSAYLCLTVRSIAASAAWALGLPDWTSRGALLAALVVGFALVLPLFGLITQTPSPGAGDNPNASAIAVQMAALFAARSRQGQPLRHTRLVLLSTDGEEAGQRGAIAYAERHRAELLATPAFVFNIDSVYRLRDLALLVSDRHGTLPLSRAMAAECAALASGLGHAVKQTPLRPGGGGTDAAAFARIGVTATTIIGIPTAVHTAGLVYHTPYDTVERIEPAAVEAVMDIALNFVLRRDNLI